jgi:hypothetical protein
MAGDCRPDDPEEYCAYFFVKRFGYMADAMDLCEYYFSLFRIINHIVKITTKDTERLPHPDIEFLDLAWALNCVARAMAAADILALIFRRHEDDDGAAARAKSGEDTGAEFDEAMPLSRGFQWIHTGLTGLVGHMLSSAVMSGYRARRRGRVLGAGVWHAA